jgi:two-component system response regulator MprA
VLDVTSGVVSREDDTMLLTKKEALLLKRLMSEAPKAVPRLTLLEDVWGIGADNASNRLDVYIRRLRSKLKALSGSYRIHTIRGSGYYFDKS